MEPTSAATSRLPDRLAWNVDAFQAIDLAALDVNDRLYVPNQTRPAR
jgi:hypothetical protein